jgi:hypothetical protein
MKSLLCLRAGIPRAASEAASEAAAAAAAPEMGGCGAGTSDDLSSSCIHGSSSESWLQASTSYVAWRYSLPANMPMRCQRGLLPDLALRGHGGEVLGRECGLARRGVRP